MKKLMLLAAAAFLINMTGCAQRTVVPTSTALPAAMGQTKVTKDPNGNTLVNLKVEHMAPPQNLQPPRSVYVVWAETPDQERFNLGQLRVDENRKGRLEAKTALKVFRLIVTAEDFPTVTQPSGQEVLSTGVLEAR